jgi:hypothetical protein
MTITTVDGLVNALGNNSSRILIDKASISNAAASQYHSLWRATGQPGQGAIPTTTAVCNNSLTGRLVFPDQTSPATSYLAWSSLVCSNAAVTMEVHDRLMHMGGLNGTLTTGQTVDLDLNANLASSNLDERKGDSNFSDVSWWMEWYADTGGTGVSTTVNVTYNDGSSGNLTAFTPGTTRRASFMIPLNGYIPAAEAGKYIRDINTVTLFATTGAAGNFGFTATRHRATMPMIQANLGREFDWAQLGLPEIYNDSCLFLIQYASTTSTGAVRGQAKLAHG